jgi:DNA-binding transcriptional ArsR family regulator
VTHGGEAPITIEVKRLADALLAAVEKLEAKYRRVCLEAGNANTKIYQLLVDSGPLHFYELIMRSGLSRSTVHTALTVLRGLGLVEKDPKTDEWRTV